MDITSIGASALIAASQAVDTYADNLANVYSPAYQPTPPTFSPIVSGGSVAVFTQNTQQPIDYLGQAIGLIQASDQYQAAASLVRTGEELNATFLQTIA